MAIERRIHRDIRGESSTRSGDTPIAELAACQHGVVTRAQLITLGVGDDAIDRRIARGLLHPIHRGVFAVGHRLRTREATWLAAVFAGGHAAVLGFRSGGALWGMRDSGRLEVISPRRLDRPGIQAHRIALVNDEMTVEDGIPVTTPARTLFDLAAVVTPDQLEHAFNEAEYRRLSSPAAHGTRKAFEDDRARDRALQAAGWRVVRITWRQLTADPDGIAADLRALLDG